VADPKKTLLESDVDSHPLRQFKVWWDEGMALGLPDSDAVTLATATRDGIPSARMVLLKGHDERGLVFFTNYGSHKARELMDNPRACIVLFWAPLHRQIRVIGTVAKVSGEESEAYFRTRPRGSQIGAWASMQSAVLESRGALEAQVAEIEKKYAGKDVPLPPHWGGFRLTPTSVEFWQGRESRLHDRLRYTRRADSSWRIERLSP
jgi:pyridoxamine 5'-phosphate oxidase